jgi:hypothetical protein
MRPSRVGPLDEKSARLSNAAPSAGAALKLAVSLLPACARRAGRLARHRKAVLCW